ncbi:MAG: PorP/SprF family type IX secretion system membrane protein [Crocinitomicaceae bacterium]|nr:PorP/SprF family type IX secretion system membrane protein [Crocinitomicaceae bacterium]
MKKVLSIFALAATTSFAQDIHFTQSQQTPMLLNPAATGLFNGWERVTVNHKNQWVNSGTKFFTTSLAADMNFFKPKRGTKAHMGFGIQLYNDIGGDSKMGTKQALLNVSGIVPLSEMHTLSAGLQVGFGQRTGDLTGLIFPNQFDGDVLDPTLNSNESNSLVSFLYPEVSAGFLYKYGNQKVGFSRDDQVDFKIGIAYFHANSPELTYRIGFTEDLYSKLVIHTSFLKDFSGSSFGFEAFFNEFIQGPHNETLMGALLRYRLSSGTKTTGLSRDAYLMVGAAYRYGDSVSPLLYLQMSSFKFGISYDVTISNFGQYSRMGGLEFSLEYANLDFALFKRRGI